MKPDKTVPNWHLTNDKPHFNPGDRVRHVSPDLVDFPFLTFDSLAAYMEKRGTVYRANYENANCVGVDWDVPGKEPALAWCGRDTLEIDPERE